MDSWKEIVEEGQVYWINEELGNIIKVGESSFVSCVPKIIKLGPFETLEQAQQALALNKKSLDETLDNFNNELMAFCKSLRQQ